MRFIQKVYISSGRGGISEYSSYMMKILADIQTKSSDITKLGKILGKGSKEYV